MRNADVIAAALDFGYTTPEGFSRAFRRVWGISPAQFRATRRFSGLHPRFIVTGSKGVKTMPNRKQRDESELYDELNDYKRALAILDEPLGRAREESGYIAVAAE